MVSFLLGINFTVFLSFAINRTLLQITNLKQEAGWTKQPIVPPSCFHWLTKPRLLNSQVKVHLEKKRNPRMPFPSCVLSLNNRLWANSLTSSDVAIRGQGTAMDGILQSVALTASLRRKVGGYRVKLISTLKATASGVKDTTDWQMMPRLSSPNVYRKETLDI